jgi:hypothetical protein
MLSDVHVKYILEIVNSEIYISYGKSCEEGMRLYSVIAA